ncbi:ABC transporter permease [Phytohabitans aurantiacus]|jgi:ABC-2 type transport system permease protein|uniref:ABC transporter n=1 Tax=Phytohabitans aurantiacus TaxID=3016789 RepID=A0ABQ5QSQ0_9ACTN|nr:ABC transporter permease [Phytohabitans aurantiacus]GLH97277.1 ABC transporter [Phytohabitans aurantiacus]
MTAQASARSEWIKLWSVRSTWWCLASSVLLMAACAWTLGKDFVHDLENPAEQAVRDTTATTMPLHEPLVLSALLAQFAVVAFAMLAMTGEYATGLIRSTLRAQPSRGRVLLAKVGVVGAVTFASGLVLGVAGLAAAQLGLSDYAVVDGGATAGAVFRVAAYLTLVSAISVGMGAILRGGVGTMGAVLVLLVGPLLIAGPLSDYLPGTAGATFLRDGTARDGIVLALWTAAVLAAAYTTLRRRDA